MIKKTRCLDDKPKVYTIPNKINMFYGLKIAVRVASKTIGLEEKLAKGLKEALDQTVKSNQEKGQH